ncbi:DUF2851 family protein [Pedobacter duraquae]|uniref:Uncharacterized protein DUF2851 n=1 Tax=Pedobacter duraquae TaxID=425511 RepID=A0A4R6IKY1_9SPHI|nr:DUF2851 family protein [Pedobacter duraquae]TDO22742.1 uncharacterized protein DUF2851 [Pedobacter duraquae]
MAINENFLSFLWQFRLFTAQPLYCVDGERLRVIHPGWLNTHAGPDFMQATLEIGGVRWVGNVEIHVNASDWFLHNHELDKSYDSVVLHVVYAHDRAIYRGNQTLIPAFEIKEIFDVRYLQQYQQLINERTVFPCAAQVTHVDPLTVSWMLSRVLADRLERKSDELLQQVKHLQGDWEAALYHCLARSFGFKTNTVPFELLAASLRHPILVKHHRDPLQVDALIFGQAGFLAGAFEEIYPQQLQEEYNYLRKKWRLVPIDVSLWKFLRMRPASFPTVRLAQFAALMWRTPVLFAELMHCRELHELHHFFEQLSTASYWDHHYTFKKVSAGAHTHMGISSVNSILINAFCIVLYSYGKHTANQEYKDRAISFLEEIAAERNHLVDSYAENGIKIENAFDSQAILELNKYYCSQKKCLNCGIGVKLLKR